MKFVKKQCADDTLDLVCRMCPLHLLEPGERLKCLKKGQDVNALQVDLLSLSGISPGAPKGVGALYFRDKLRLMPLIHGGIQENGRRGGTENVPGIVGLGKAAELAGKEFDENTAYVSRLRD